MARSLAREAGLLRACGDAGDGKCGEHHAIPALFGLPAREGDDGVIFPLASLIAPLLAVRIQDRHAGHADAEGAVSAAED
jgi:hypothetical protein